MRRQLGEDVREDVRALPARKVAAAMSDERLSQALHSARKSSTRLPAAAAEGRTARALVHCHTQRRPQFRSPPSARMSAQRARPPQRQRPASASVSLARSGAARTPRTGAAEVNTKRASMNVLLFARAHALVESAAGDSSWHRRRTRTPSGIGRDGVGVGLDWPSASSSTARPSSSQSSRSTGRTKAGASVAVAAAAQGQRVLPQRSNRCDVHDDERSYQRGASEWDAILAEDHVDMQFGDAHEFGAWTEENDRATAGISRRRMSAVSSVDRCPSARGLPPESSTSAVAHPLLQEAASPQVCQVHARRRSVRFADENQATLKQTVPEQSSRSLFSPATKPASSKKKKKKMQAGRVSHFAPPPPRSRHGVRFVGGVRVVTSNSNRFTEQRSLQGAIGAAAAVAHSAAQAAHVYATVAALVAWQSDEHLEQATKLATEGNLGEEEQRYFANVLEQAEIRADNNELERTVALMRQLSQTHPQSQGDASMQTRKSGKNQAAKNQNVLKNMAARAEARRRAAAASAKRKLKRQIKVTNAMASLGKAANSAHIALAAKSAAKQPPASAVKETRAGARMKHTSRRASTSSIALPGSQRDGRSNMSLSQDVSIVKLAQPTPKPETVVAIDGSLERTTSRDVTDMHSGAAEPVDPLPRRGSTVEDKLGRNFRSTALGRAWERSGGRRRSLAGDEYRMQWLQRSAKAAAIAAVVAQRAAFDAQRAASRAEHHRHRSMRPNMVAAALQATQELARGENSQQPCHDHRQGVLLLREPQIEPTDPEALLLPVGLAELDIRRWRGRNETVAAGNNSDDAQSEECTSSEDEASSSRPGSSHEKLNFPHRSRRSPQRARVRPRRSGWGAWCSRVVLLQLDPTTESQRLALSPASKTPIPKADISVDKWLTALAPSKAARPQSSREMCLQARVLAPLQHIPPLPIAVAARRKHLGWPVAPRMNAMLSHIVLLDFSNSATARIMRNRNGLPTSNGTAGQPQAASLELVHTLCEALIDSSASVSCTSTEPLQLQLPALKVIVVNEAPHFVHELTGRIMPPLQRHTPAILRAGVAAGFDNKIQSKTGSHGHRLSPCFASREAFSAALCAKSLTAPLTAFPVRSHFSVCAADVLLIARMLRIAPARRCIMPPQYDVLEPTHGVDDDEGPEFGLRSGSNAKDPSMQTHGPDLDDDYSYSAPTAPLLIDVTPPEMPVNNDGSTTLPRPRLQPHFLLRGGVEAAAAAAPAQRPDPIVVASGRRPRVDLTDGGRRTTAAIELMHCFAPRPVWLKKNLALVAHSRHESQIWSDGRAAWQQSYGAGAGESAQLAWSGVCGQIWGGGGGGAKGSHTLRVLRALCSTVRGRSHDGGVAAQQVHASRSAVDAPPGRSPSGAVQPDLALSWVSPLTSLDLRGNCIGPDGLLIIAHVLLGNDGKDSKATVVKAAAVAAAEATAASQVALSPTEQQRHRHQQQPFMWRYRCCSCRLRVLRLGYNEIVGILGKKSRGFNALVDALCKQPSSGSFTQTRAALASAQQWRALAASARDVTSARSAQGHSALQQMSHMSKLRHQLELGATAGPSAVEAAAAAAAAMAASTAAADAAGVGGNAIESLDLAANALQSDHLERLCSVLLLTHSMLRLDLSFNNLDCDAAGTLASALAERSVRLQVLNLRGNHLGGKMRPSEAGGYHFMSNVNGVIALLDQIKLNDSLTELDLGANALCGVLVAHPGDESSRDREDTGRTLDNTDPEGWGGVDGGDVGHVHECASSASGSSDEDDETDVAVGATDVGSDGPALREGTSTSLGEEGSDSDTESSLVQSSNSIAASARRAAQSARLAALSMGPGGELTGDAFDLRPFEVLCSALRSNRRLVRIGLAANALAGYFEHPRTRRMLKCKMFPLAPLKAAVCFRAGLGEETQQQGAILAPIEYIDLRGNDLQTRTAHVRRSVRKMQNAGCKVRL